MQIISWFDIIVLALILFLGLKGMLTGLIKELFGLIGIVGGILVASRFAMTSGNLISDNIYLISQDNGKYFAGFLATLLVFWVVCILLGKLISRLVSLSGLGFIDRFLGVVAGGCKIFFIISVLVAITSGIEILDNKLKPHIQKSEIYPFLLSTGKYIMNMDAKKIINSTIENVDKKLDELNVFIETNSTKEEL